MDRALVERAQAGDHDAFAELATASYPRLFRVADLILRDPERAGDVVQDTLVQAWRQIRALRDPDAWDAWLRKTTVRGCYRVAKRDRRRRLREVDATIEAGPRVAPDPSSDLAERERLERELDALDVDRRAVIVLHYYLDLPLTEVAELLDIPAGTAKSRLHRGLDAMRASMTTADEPTRKGRTEARA